MAGPVAGDDVEPAPALIARLRADGFELSVQGDRLRIRPVARVTAELRRLLERRKPELVALLEPVTEYITLRPGPAGGLTAPLPALRLLWTLEERGFRLRQQGDCLLVEPAADLTPADCTAIQRWTCDLIALVNYEPPEAS